MKRISNPTKGIFILYCLMLVWIVLFKTAFSLSDLALLRTHRHIHLIPFSYSAAAGRHSIKESCLNILVFIPMGLYLRMLSIPWKKAVGYGCICSFLMELCQFLFAIGASDTTDLITNTLGTAIGVAGYALAGVIFRSKQTTDRVINTLAVIALTLFSVLILLLLVAN